MNEELLSMIEQNEFRKPRVEEYTTEREKVKDMFTPEQFEYVDQLLFRYYMLLGNEDARKHIREHTPIVKRMAVDLTEANEIIERLREYIHEAELLSEYDPGTIHYWYRRAKWEEQRNKWYFNAYLQTGQENKALIRDGNILRKFLINLTGETSLPHYVLENALLRQKVNNQKKELQEKEESNKRKNRRIKELEGK